MTAPADWKPNKVKDKKTLELRAGKLELDVSVDYATKHKPLSDRIDIWRCSSNVLHTQKHDVKGLKGVLMVKYISHLGQTVLEWRGDLDVHPEHRYGDTVTIGLTYPKTSWVTKPQLQQFVDLLASTKFKVPPRKK